ncbi:MAG: hypothetical protein ACJ8FY_16225 [Gemmataceae bacterium]
MIQARIHQGCLEIEDPIPAEWEGQMVKILPMTPDDPLPPLEVWLATLHALGPMEWEPSERETIAVGLGELDRISKEAMLKLPR